MLFTSPAFYALFAAVLALFLLLPWRAGRLMLLLASYIFYGAAEPWYCLLLLASTVVDYLVALRIDQSDNARNRLAWLRLSLTLNLGILAVFKYADFGIDNINFLLSYLGLANLPGVALILPIGISFYTFQTLSYTIDVYRGNTRPTRDFASFALYVAFFPQLVAGPIERARNLLPQFERKPKVSWEDLQIGFQRVLWGLTKKLVFADRLALTVNAVFANPMSYSSAEILLAVLCFSFQLYLDFSAYVDIAIGLARILGIRLSENFNYPFLARNMSEFWSRWHITLTSWFRDYLFQALGGNRRSQPLLSMLAVIIVMSAMGLWHGAAWHYIAFGFVSAVVLIAYTQARLKTGRKKLFGEYWWSAPLAYAIMFVLVNLIMIIFRADNLVTAWQIIQRIAELAPGWQPRFYLPLALLAVAATLHIARGAYPRYTRNLPLQPAVRAGFWVVMLLMIYFLQLDRTERFIYFQF